MAAARRGCPFGGRRRRSNWRDRADTPVEAALPELFAEIAARVIETGRAVERDHLAEIVQREQTRRAAAERERRWQEIPERARGRFIEDRRIGDLEEGWARRGLTV